MRHVILNLRPAKSGQGFQVLKSCGHAVVQSCGPAVVQSCGRAGPIDELLADQFPLVGTYNIILRKALR